MFFHPRDITYYKTLEENSNVVFHLLEKNIGVNTFFLSVTDQRNVYFVNVFNRKDTLIEMGTVLPFKAVF